jgi:hypothetical protein
METRKMKNGERNGVQQFTLVDDDCGVRESVRQLLKRDERFAVLSEHARAKDALKKLTDMPTNHPISCCWTSPCRAWTGSSAAI